MPPSGSMRGGIAGVSGPRTLGRNGAGMTSASTPRGRDAGARAREAERPGSWAAKRRRPSGSVNPVTAPRDRGASCFPRSPARPTLAARGARARSFVCAPGTRPVVACSSARRVPPCRRGSRPVPAHRPSRLSTSTPGPSASPPTGSVCFPSSRPGPSISPAPSRLRWTAASRRRRRARGPSRPRCCAQRWHSWIDSIRPR